MILDGKDAVLGRLATYAAKAALEGEEVAVVNAGDILIVGSKNDIIKKYRERLEIGTMSKGPFFPRDIRGIVRRAIRGMLKRKRLHGREALARIKIFEDLPAEFKDKNIISTAKVRTDKPVHKLKIAELSNILKYKKI
jgi:large subunit ribosomal protein L13